MKEREILKSQLGAPNGLVEILPNDYDGKKKFPLLIWWHGLGEVGYGTDASLDRLQKNIVPWSRKNEVPFIILVPQDANGWGKALPFVKWAFKNYEATIDFDSMHMAGLSSGGYMIRDFITEGSEEYKKFSTFTPMATNLDSAIPHVWRIVDNDQWVWGHAGEKDGGANMPGAMARFVKAGQQIAPERFVLTIYKGMGHSAWEEVYDSSGRPTVEISADTFEGAKLFKWVDEPKTWFDWLLSRRKKGSTVPTPEPEPPTQPEPPVETGVKVVASYIMRSTNTLYVETEDGKTYTTTVTPKL